MRILFVEDEGDARLLVGDGLRLAGFSVRLAEDGVVAMQALREETYDAVVTDVSMPNGVSGIEVAEEALRRDPSARVLIVSGYARGQLPPLPDGVTYLPKPYRFPQLIAALNAMLSGAA